MKFIRALEALNKFIEFKPGAVLDVGSGGCEAADYMKSKGIKVTTIDAHMDADIQSDYIEHQFSELSSIWCCHVLEHCLNVHDVLSKFKRELMPGGVVAISVPPLRNKLVGGHLNNFTPATLIYNLIIAGFDCANASVYTDDRSNISIIVRNVDLKLPFDLISDAGDIEKLSQFFPCDVWQAIDGQFKNINWNKIKEPR